MLFVVILRYCFTNCCRPTVFAAARIELALSMPAEASDRRTRNTIKPPEITAFWPAASLTLLAQNLKTNVSAAQPSGLERSAYRQGRENDRETL